MNRGGRSSTSVVNLPQFRVTWRDVTEVKVAVTSGMTEAQAKMVSRNGKPLLVYVYNDEVDDQARYSIEEAGAFFDDKVAVGARLFDCVRIDMESAKSDGALKEHLGRENTIVFLRPDYTYAESIEFKSTKVKARSVFGAMCKTMKLDYENCVSTTYKKMKALQKERIKLEKDASKVADFDEKILRETSANKREKLVASRDKVQEALDAEYAKLDEQENKLFDLVAKTSGKEKMKDSEKS
jgi:hypothetical protein